MKIHILLRIVFLVCMLFPVCIHAQNDTNFIENYKKFRAFVDPLPEAYNMYLVPKDANIHGCL